MSGESGAVEAVAEAHRMDNGQCACGYDPLPGTPFVNDWLRHVLTEARPAIEREAKAAAWDEAAQALAWLLDNGPEESAPAYLRDNNPYRTEREG